MNLFSMDNLFFRTMSKITDLVWLNILTLLGCLPVITGGASLTAMYSVLLRMVRDEEGSVTRNFIRGFRENFKNATKVWIVALLAALFFFMDFNILRQGVLDGYDTLYKVSIAAITILIVLLLMILQYTFPLLARYDRDLKGTLRNAVIIMVARVPRTVSMLIIWLFPVALMILSNYFLWFWFLYGLAFPGYFCSMVLRTVFEKFEEP